jgi:hypothetical protein
VKGVKCFFSLENPEWPVNWASVRSFGPNTHDMYTVPAAYASWARPSGRHKQAPNQAQNLAPPPKGKRSSGGETKRRRRRREERCSSSCPRWWWNTARWTRGRPRRWSSWRSATAARPRTPTVQPGLLRRAPPPPHPACVRGPQAAAAAGPRDLPQRRLGGHRRRGGRHRARHPGPDPRPGPAHRHRADVPRRRGEVARRHPRGGARDVVPWHQGAAFLSFRVFISILSNALPLRAWVFVAALR